MSYLPIGSELKVVGDGSCLLTPQTRPTVEMIPVMSKKLLRGCMDLVIWKGWCEEGETLSQRAQPSQPAIVKWTICNSFAHSSGAAVGVRVLVDDHPSLHHLTALHLFV